MPYEGEPLAPQGDDIMDEISEETTKEADHYQKYGTFCSRFSCVTLPNISKTTSHFTLNLQFKYYSTKNCDFKLYFAVFAEHFRYFDL